MAENEEQTTTEGNGAGEEEAMPVLARRATRSLRRARKTYQGNEWQSSEEANFLVQEANVLAIMDLAEAVREQSNSKAGS